MTLSKLGDLYIIAMFSMNSYIYTICIFYLTIAMGVGRNEIKL